MLQHIGRYLAPYGRAGTLTSLANGHTACEATANWIFKSPTTYNENLALSAVLGATSQAWLNVTDSLLEDKWVQNIANLNGFPNHWAATEPNNGNLDFSAESTSVKGEDCVYQDTDGALHDESCETLDTRSWACSAGSSQWRVTATQSGSDADKKVAQFANGHRYCFEEFGGDWLFAAPSNKQEAMLLDQAMTLADNDAPDTDISTVWLNMTDGAFEDEDVTVVLGCILEPTYLIPIGILLHQERILLKIAPIRISLFMGPQVPGKPITARPRLHTMPVITVLTGKSLPLRVSWLPVFYK